MEGSSRIAGEHVTRRLFTGATTWAGDACAPTAGWLLTENGLIRSIGGPADQMPDADEQADVAGRHILPGLVDVHSHLTLAALIPAGGDAAGWRGVRDALAGVRRAALADPDAPWLLFWNASPQDWPQARLPTADELEHAAPSRKVLLCGVDLHRGAVSRAGLDALSVSVGLGRGRHADDIGRTRRGLTGEMWEAAFGTALRHAVEESSAHLGGAGVAALLRAEVRRHLAAGVTHVHDPYVPPSMHQRLVALRAATPLGMSWATGPETGLLAAPADPADAPDGPYGDAGREVKLFLDGADRCSLRLPAAALPGLVAGTVRQGWRHRSAGPVRAGLRRQVVLRGGQLETPYLRFTDHELQALLGRYVEAGFRLRLHALGNLAVAQAARALAASGIPAGAATIDHLTVLDRRTADLVAASGAQVSIQPGFLPRFGSQFVTLGIDRYLAVLGGRLLIQAGVPLVISSDHPCGPLDPLANLRAAVSRRVRTGELLQPGQALSASEAVHAASVGAARSLGAEGPGGLVPGAAANLTICTGDPFSPGTHVAETWIGGRRVWPPGSELAAEMPE